MSDITHATLFTTALCNLNCAYCYICKDKDGNLKQIDDDIAREFANDSYINQRVKTFWMNSGLYYGIYLVLGVFMGLMIFLLTRGKANPNRGLTFWITTKISWIACVAPAILAMIAGFFWSMAAGLGFIVLFGLRIMWLSMRSLSPQQ